MAKMDKEYEARMQGMLYAANIVKEHDLEYLEKEIKRRGVIKSPLAYTDKQIDEFWNQLSELILYATMTCVTGMVMMCLDLGSRDYINFEKSFRKRRMHHLTLIGLVGIMQH